VAHSLGLTITTSTFPLRRPDLVSVSCIKRALLQRHALSGAIASPQEAFVRHFLANKRFHEKRIRLAAAGLRLADTLGQRRPAPGNQAKVSTCQLECARSFSSYSQRFAGINFSLTGTPTSRLLGSGWSPSSIPNELFDPAYTSDLESTSRHDCPC